MIKAIETNYQDYRFRSRTEARWAVYFDAIGLKWDYELQGFEFGQVRYLPDFWLPEMKMWAEVKPVEFFPDESAKILLLARHTGFACLMLVGVPSAKPYDFIEVFEGHKVRGECVICPTKTNPPVFMNPHGIDPRKWVGISEAVAVARGARFEFGETPIIRQQ